MSNQNEHTRVDLIGSDDHDKYLLRGSREIRQILQGLIDGHALVTAQLSPGQQSFLTALIALPDDGSSVLVDASADEHINQRVSNSEKLICMTQLDKIRIQFELQTPAATNHDGHPAFRAAVPDQLFRLQRREFYRLQTPVTHAVSCRIPIPQADGKKISLETRVIDISAGGVAVVVPPDNVPFSADMEFIDCQLQLPELGTIAVRLRVRNIFRLTNRNGIQMLRAGCEFVDLPRSADNAIQRYIFKVERERSARERGRL